MRDGVMDAVVAFCVGAIFGGGLVTAMVSVSQDPTPDELMGARITGVMCGFEEFNNDKIAESACLGFCEDAFPHHKTEERCKYGYTEWTVRNNIVQSHGSKSNER